MFRNSYRSHKLVEKPMSYVSVFLLVLIFSVVASSSEVYSQCLTPPPVAPSGLTLGSTSILTPTPTTTPTGTASGLVGYWTFDERSGTTACDSSGKGNIGTLTNGPLWAVGKIGGALYFDGIDDKVTVADSDSLDVSSSFTLSAWVNPASSFTDFRSILVKNYKYYLYASTASYCGSGSLLAGFDEQTSNTVCQATPLPANTWTHLAVTYTGSVLTLYRNGVAVATSTITKTLSATTGTLQIGASQFGENFKGLIDEVRVHNRSLTGTEVQGIFQQESAVRESGLIAHWKFDEGNGITAADSSGSANAGILTNGPLWTDGRIGKALYFDGNDDNVTVADSNSLDVTSSFTLSAWVNPASSFSDFRSILIKNYKYYLYASAAGSCGTGNPLAGFDEQTSNTLCQASPLPANTWTHLAATYTGSVLTLYRNGIAVATSNITKTLSPSTGNLQIGASQFGENFKGVIDEVRVHNRALSNTEILAIFQQESGGVFSYFLSNSGDKSVIAGSSVTNSVAASIDFGSTQSISFSISGLPSGATASFSSPSCVPGCSTLVTINTTGSTPAGSFPITVTSTGGDVIRRTGFTLSVTLAFAGTAGPISIPSTGNGVIYYVATTGSDSNTCADAQNVTTPKLTIAAGITCLRANPLGNRLEIRGGTYPETLRGGINVTWPSGTSWSNAPVIAAYTGETVTLRPSSGAELISISTSFLIFDGLILDAININDGRDSTFGINGNAVGVGGDHVRFRNGEIKNAPGMGILSGCDFLEIINMNIHHNGDHEGLDHGIYWYRGSDGLIENSQIHDNATYGLHIYDGTGTYRASRNIIRNNKFYNQGTGILIASYGSDNQVYNNIVINNKRGIELSYGTIGTKVYNNSIFNNYQTGIAVDGTVRNSILKNNILYQNGSATGTGIDDSGIGMGTVKTNNLSNDPKFVSPAADDFRLQSTSPAIDTGVVLSEIATDFVGRSRPQGVTYDIGAFEY
jgi:parallel beta-helix repeat protein